MNSIRSTQLQATIPSREQMHQAVETRDARFDGRFYYGVITTGVYCRPSCASRPANRDNVRFFDSAKDAESAGFRACKRCRPDRISSEVDNLVGIAEHIVAHADEKLTLAVLSARAGLSPSRLQKAFKAAFGVSPKAFQDAVRLNRFKGALKNGDDVTGAVYAAGFGSTSRIYGHAARGLGMTPAAYRAGGAGESIHYACRESALGLLMMAATSRGVCFAQFGASLEELRDRLQREFPEAVIAETPSGSEHQLDDWMEALDGYLRKDAPRPDLPLDLRGTAFQLKVWRFLLSVKEGDVVSYGEVAARVDEPRAARAAASACAANRIAVLVPCHRVLRGTGELGGYRWGLERKRTLLDLERGRRTGRA